MHSFFLLSFALLPTAALAQARTISSVAPETTMTAAISGAPAAVAIRPAHYAHVQEIIRTYVSPEPNLSYDPGISVTFGKPNYETAPKLKAWSNIAVSDADLASVPAQTSVELSLMVDRSGLPQNLHIEHSASKAIDESVLSAVKNFRFQAATEEHIPVDKLMTLTVTINKK